MSKISRSQCTAVLVQSMTMHSGICKICLGYFNRDCDSHRRTAAVIEHKASRETKAWLQIVLMSP